MQTIKLSKRQLENLELYNVPHEVSNSEGLIYYLKTGIKKIDKENLLFKKLFINHDTICESKEKEGYVNHSNSMSNKFHTISRLNDYKGIMNLEELVVPKHQVEYLGDVIGFTIPEIKDVKSLEAKLADIKVHSEDKIDCLKQIGETLKKIHHLRLYDIYFYIHDLQEGNILVTNKDNKVHFIDLDSATFSTEHALPSKPLTTDKKLLNYSKYKSNIFGIPYPGVDQDLYSYNIMILRMLYNDEIKRLSKEEFDNYISYLASLGIDNDLIRSFSCIYSEAPNLNPVDKLDTLTLTQIAQASNVVYKLKRKSNLF